jgi:hypothetical protein
VAGAADMLSGIFRETLWNQTIPDSLRGRLAGVELLSYSLGPSAGQIRAGAVAAATSTRFAPASGCRTPSLHPHQPQPFTGPVSCVALTR